jgi:hypothetical protein
VIWQESGLESSGERMEERQEMTWQESELERT